MELDPQVSPEEIMSREVELGCESWTSFASTELFRLNTVCSLTPSGIAFRDQGRDLAGLS